MAFEKPYFYGGSRVEGYFTSHALWVLVPECAEEEALSPAPVEAFRHQGDRPAARQLPDIRAR
ncbi:hypothetical protein EYF80_021238 [Liparis tanakae]|uniref:Uncharacterized protein n=1 Tax=Liparis tanakae TaxID=230148 RepID=A0A4Z2HUK5_9TELE|nr:hypothetical protein EYF80_021238 [Liparis tanakae]